jgi:hypothetical protein
MGRASVKEDRVGDEKPGDKVRVIDRRWFNSEGELKEPIAASPVATNVEPPTAPEPPPAPAAPAPELPPPVRLPQRAVLEVVDFLAQYAMAFLTGEVPELGRDPQAARLFIDLLAEVQKRTQGQLSAQEAKVLDDVLYQLRAHYISPR